MNDPRSGARAAVLIGTMSTATIEATELAQRRRAALVQTLDAAAQPLDLTAEPFRYLVLSPAHVMPLRPLPFAACRRSHRHR